MDYFLYSGPIERGADLNFIEKVAANKNSNSATIVLSTGGGSPDAAYKIGKYLQARYESLKVFIPGFCKSAGTLLAISADELIFSPYGELGPLDVQMTKQDNLMGMESGLNISEAFASMERRARETFHNVVAETVSGSGGVVSFAAAAKSAADMVASMYGPIFSQIDPEEVGSRSRAMRIGDGYGVRLNQRFRNMRDGAMEVIAQSYPSHGFVIDMEEASALFERVREASTEEKQLVEVLGSSCRIPEDSLHITCVTEHMLSIRAAHAEAKTDGNERNAGDAETPINGKDSSGAGEGKRTSTSKRASQTGAAK